VPPCPPDWFKGTPSRTRAVHSGTRHSDLRRRCWGRKDKPRNRARATRSCFRGLGGIIKAYLIYWRGFTWDRPAGRSVSAGMGPAPARIRLISICGSHGPPLRPVAQPFRAPPGSDHHGCVVTGRSYSRSRDASVPVLGLMSSCPRPPWCADGGEWAVWKTGTEAAFFPAAMMGPRALLPRSETTPPGKNGFGPDDQGR